MTKSPPRRHRAWLLIQCLAAAVTFGLALLAAPQLHAGKDADPGLLTIDRIFKSPDFQGEDFGPLRWLARQSAFTIKAPAEQPKDSSDIVRVDPATGKREVVVAARHLIPAGAAAPLAIEDYVWSSNEAQLLIYTNSQRVWRKNTRGDYWVFDTVSRELHKLGGDAPASSLMFARFSPDGRKVAYVRDRNLYVEDVGTHQIEQLTEAKTPDIINGTFDWVYEEEFHLFDGYRWSPDSQRIAFWQLDTSGMDDYYLVNNTAGLYQQLTKFKYPKVGRINAACRIGVLPLERQKGTAGAHPVYWLPLTDFPRDHYIAHMDWVDDGHVIVQQLNRLQNKNTLVLCPAVGPSIPTDVLVETDKAWVDVHGHLDWLDGGKKFTWLSERDGWRRLYVVTRDGKEIKPITPPAVDVIDVARVDEKNGLVYYYASPQNATQKYLYRVRLTGGEAQQVSPAGQAGTHGYNIDPSGKWAVHTYSTFDSPPMIDLVTLPEHLSIRKLAENQKLDKAVKALKRLPSEFFRIDIGDGVELDGWMIKPPDFDPAKRYPVLFHVYGEPAGQTVLDRWSGPNGLWHLMLAQEGYLVMSVDNRGTPAPRGRDWRRIVYRQVGILAPKEQAAAVRAILKSRPYVDAERVGVWGWSGGGSMSLNAILRYPDLYHLAMAVAPVSNQRHYDTIYQERYMGLPQDNPDGYRDGSPITHAQQLKGNLLLVHGTADDNVHYAGTEALMNELIAANKQFSMMAYPNRSHSIQEGPNTRRHLFTLLTRYLKQNLPPGARSR
jgi:dipeptidyl-peptidase-4